MKPAQVRLVAIDRATWEACPSDRPLVALHKDATGSRRRVGKQIDVARERLRYIQLCGWIEEVVLDFASVVDQRWLRILDTDAAAMYLLLLEALQRMPDVGAALTAPVKGTTFIAAYRTVVASWLVRDPEEKARRQAEARLRVREYRTSSAPPTGAEIGRWVAQSLGANSFAPGDELQAEISVFSQLTLPRIRLLFPSAAPATVISIAEVVVARLDFLRSAASQGRAVVEVLTSVP